MTQKQLKTYLEKAKYLRLLIKGTTTPLLSPPSFHYQTNKSLSRISSNLKRAPYKSQNLKALSELLNSSELVKISFASESNSEGLSPLNTAKRTNTIGNQLDLHLLHYKTVYYASRKTSCIQWKRPQKFNAAQKLQEIMSLLQTAPAKSVIAKFAKISSKESDALQEGKDTMEENGLAREREYSGRRNYRSSTHLYT